MTGPGVPADDDPLALTDEELAVELEVDEELAFEEPYPLRLIEADDDRFASAVPDIGSFAPEELAMHLVPLDPDAS